MKSKIILTLTALFIFSCFPKKEVVKDDIKIDQVVIEPIKDKKADLIKNYKGSNTIFFDLIHTKLKLSFDYNEKHVFGSAEISLSPHYYSTDSLILDAQGFDIHKVEMLQGEKLSGLKYSYDQKKLKIDLNKIYNRDDKIHIKIDYTAKPNELKSSGSAAIRSNKGLYFVGSDSDKPQIWTQGETQSNSAWFPTLDSPNQKMSQEIFLTVKNEYKTLSNGILVESLANNDGTRTDHWKQEKPHAPYLAMIAIGKFEVIEDYWRDLPVFVYVEKEKKDKAEALFKKTYKMIEFYSKKLDYDFPWDKYSQIVVRNFVSGAMENTGAVVFGDFVLNYSTEDQRINYECIVAHELAHHWFGDLVTCESWANLPLNEAFATYFEYLWLEHEYGRYTADIHLAKDYQNYNFERIFKDEDLIRFYNKHRDNMFDAHSYQKGGLVLHMLRYTIGEEAFWDALELYLRNNEYKPVEIHHLRLAFEEVTGQDLNWFFNQWFLNKGIPEFKISYSYDNTQKISSITIDQTQNFKKSPLYKIPTFVDIYLKDTVIRKNILINEASETFNFKVNEKPLFLNFDPENSILCKKDENYSTAEYIEILDKAPFYADKNQAFKKLSRVNNKELNKVYFKLLSHEYGRFRYNALSKIQIESSDLMYSKYLEVLEDYSVNDNYQRVRKLAKNKLEQIK